MTYSLVSMEPQNQDRLPQNQSKLQTVQKNPAVYVKIILV